MEAVSTLDRTIQILRGLPKQQLDIEGNISMRERHGLRSLDGVADNSPK